MKRIIQVVRDMKLSPKLFISYMMICIIPLMVLGSFSYAQANEFLREQAIRNFQNNVSQLAREIDARCGQHKLITESVISNFKYRQIFGDLEKDELISYADYIDPFFNSILYLNKDLFQITVFTDKTGLIRGEYIQSLVTASDQPWFKPALTKNDAYWYDKNGRVLCLRSFKSTGSGNQTEKTALLFLSIDTSVLFEGITQKDLSDSGVIITGQEGGIILQNKVAPGTWPRMRDLPYDGDRSAFSVDGSRYLAVRVNLPTPGWHLYACTPIQTLAIDPKRIAQATVLIIAICLVVLSLLNWRISSSFVKRLRYLNKTMKIVEEGNLAVEVVSHSNDEIGELTTHFGEMLGKINTLVHDIYNSRLIQKEAELKALQAQINPHFLYNSLSIINWKAIQIDALEISQITNAISMYYRTVLNRGKNTISIRDEIQNASLYIQIQLIMHSNKFDYVCDVDENLLQYDMPNLILQPILENALEHGIDQKRKNEGRGVLCLKGAFMNGLIVFSISDNGPGMSTELMNGLLMKDSKGYGLKNVNDRIALFFGPQYGLRIESEPGSGTTVFVTIPMFNC